MKAETPLFDKELIGKRIGSGADRVVYLYQENKVIKFSSFAFIGGERVRQKYIHDHEIALRYLKKFVVPVEVVSQPSSRSYVEVQPRIKGVPLETKHIQNPTIKLQVLEIKNNVDAMIQDGFAPIDLIGRTGLYRSCAENIWIDDNDHLQILDTVLLETKSVGPSGLIMAPFMPLVKYRQSKILDQWTCY